MGYDSVNWRVTGRVSRHNSERDDNDNALWNELTQKLYLIANQPRYNSLLVMSDSPSDMPEDRWGPDDPD